MKEYIEQAWEQRELLEKREHREAVQEVVRLLDCGELRVAEQMENGTWKVNEWVKKAVLLYFPICGMQTLEAGPMEYHDKIPLKSHFAEGGVRVVPPAVARYGAYLAPGTILMPSYVNIGAYVDSGTMVDTWATVGIGRCGYRRRIGARTRGTRHRGRQLLHRQPLHHRRRCPYRTRGCAGFRYRHHCFDTYHRCHWPRTRDVYRPRAGTQRRHSRQLPETFPCRRLQRLLRPYHRTKKRINGQKNISQ